MKYIILSLLLLVNFPGMALCTVISGQSMAGPISIENNPPAGVDWSEGDAKLRAIPIATLSTDKPIVKAGETETLTLTVENLGKGTNSRLKGRIASDDKRFNNQMFWFGKVLPDRKKSYILKVPIDAAAIDRIVPFKITFSEMNKNIPSTVESHVIVRSAPKPEFAYAFQIFDRKSSNTSGNGDGLVQKGETVNIQLKIKNTGPVDARNASASIGLDRIPGVSINKAEIQLGKIAADAEKTVSFIVSVREDFNYDSLKLKVTIGDSFYNVYLKDDLALTVYRKPVGKFEPIEKEIITSREADIFGGADLKSQVIATTKRPILLEVSGQLADFYRVRAPLSENEENFIYGWLPVEQGKDSKIVNQTILKQLTKPAIFRYYKKSPVIELDSPVDGSSASGNQIRIKGRVSDDKGISKIYFLMNNQIIKVNDVEMIMTPANDSEKYLINFNISAPPQEQFNLVSVVAENVDDLRSIKAAFVTEK